MANNFMLAKKNEEFDRFVGTGYGYHRLAKGIDLFVDMVEDGHDELQVEFDFMGANISYCLEAREFSAVMEEVKEKMKEYMEAMSYMHVLTFSEYYLPDGN